MFTGRPDGTIVGCADDVARALPGFMVEPDRRNLEYATPPAADYHQQLRQLLEPRRTLRAWLQRRDLTLVPGSCLSLGDSRYFERSDPANQEQLQLGAMHNVRHLWCSVRPNGRRRPYEIDRVEVRICDLLDDPLDLLAVASFCELRLLQLLADPGRQDPLWASTMDADALAALADHNDQAAARQSLAARLHHWRDGHGLTAAQWLRQSLQDVQGLAESLGLEGWLRPLHGILRHGNRSMRWLRSHGEGESIRAIVRREAVALECREHELYQRLYDETPVTASFAAPTTSLAAP